eukprot:scaffold1311_cov256-Pinguiococcus_pyrenoidosus.AAC.20
MSLVRGFLGLSSGSSGSSKSTCGSAVFCARSASSAAVPFRCSSKTEVVSLMVSRTSSAMASQRMLSFSRPGHQCHERHRPEAQLAHQDEGQRQAPDGEEARGVPGVHQRHRRLDQALRRAYSMRHLVQLVEEAQSFPRGERMAGQLLGRAAVVLRHHREVRAELVDQEEGSVSGFPELLLLLRVEVEERTARQAREVLPKHPGEGAEEAAQLREARLSEEGRVAGCQPHQVADVVLHALPDLAAFPEALQGVRLRLGRAEAHRDLQRVDEDRPEREHRHRLPNALEKHAAGQREHVVHPVAGGIPLRGRHARDRPRRAAAAAVHEVVVVQEALEAPGGNTGLSPPLHVADLPLVHLAQKSAIAQRRLVDPEQATSRGERLAGAQGQEQQRADDTTIHPHEPHSVLQLTRRCLRHRHSLRHFSNFGPSHTGAPDTSTPSLALDVIPPPQSPAQTANSTRSAAPALRSSEALRFGVTPETRTRAAFSAGASRFQAPWAAFTCSTADHSEALRDLQPPREPPKARETARAGKGRGASAAILGGSLAAVLLRRLPAATPQRRGAVRRRQRASSVAAGRIS